MLKLSFFDKFYRFYLEVKNYFLYLCTSKNDNSSMFFDNFIFKPVFFI